MLYTESKAIARTSSEDQSRLASLSALRFSSDRDKAAYKPSRAPNRSTLKVFPRIKSAFSDCQWCSAPANISEIWLSLTLIYIVNWSILSPRGSTIQSGAQMIRWPPFLRHWPKVGFILYKNGIIKTIQNENQENGSMNYRSNQLVSRILLYNPCV